MSASLTFESREIENDRPSCRLSAVALVSLFPPSPFCPQDKRGRDLLFSRDVNHATDVPVCTRELTRERERKWFADRVARERRSATESEVIIGEVATESARDKDGETPR